LNEYQKSAKLNRFTSFSVCFGITFVTFGLNRIAQLACLDNIIVIVHGTIMSETCVIPTSLCTLQEEGEIVLMPGTTTDYKNNQFMKLNKEFIMDQISTADEEVLCRSAGFLDFFSNIYRIDVNINSED
jgi:hypothetical protein